MSKQGCRSTFAHSLLEVVIGVALLVPIVLFLLDIGVLILASTTNDALAKEVARTASSATGRVTLNENKIRGIAVTVIEGSGPIALAAAREAAGHLAESYI